ncbi:Imm1 family immunity protein [Actinokineospora sp. 24-640]
MTVINAYYDRGGPNVLRSAGDVSALILKVRKDSIAYGAALMTHWYVADDPETPEFSVGINGEVGVVTYSGREWPDLWSSKGSEESDDLMGYDYQGNERPVLVSGQIPYLEVIKAAEDFFRLAGERPTSVAWQVVP